MHQSGSLIQKIIRFHSNGAILEAIAIYRDDKIFPLNGTIDPIHCYYDFDSIKYFKIASEEFKSKIDKFLIFN